MSGKDVAIAAVLIFGFAAFVTTHVWLSIKLIKNKSPRTKGLVALVVPPLAPIWAYQEGYRWGAKLWLITLITYVIARVAVHL